MTSSWDDMPSWSPAGEIGRLATAVDIVEIVAAHDTDYISATSMAGEAARMQRREHSAAHTL
jgi:hypothetical protein